MSSILKYYSSGKNYEDNSKDILEDKKNKNETNKGNPCLKFIV